VIHSVTVGDFEPAYVLERSRTGDLIEGKFPFVPREVRESDRFDGLDVEDRQLGRRSEHGADRSVFEGAVTACIDVVQQVARVLVQTRSGDVRCERVRGLHDYSAHA
jgi:hypothetical protein